jgi:hypothetical protein
MACLERKDLRDEMECLTQVLLAQQDQQDQQEWRGLQEPRGQQEWRGLQDPLVQQALLV